MKTIKDFEGKTWSLSDEIYEILDNDHPVSQFRLRQRR